MAKIRIYEIAKEIGKTSKEILAVLNDGAENYTASSGIDEEAAAKVRKAFGVGEASAPKAEPAAKKEAAPEKVQKPAAKKPEGTPAPKGDRPKKPVHDGAKPGEEPRPKKKKTITAVFNAQYSRNPSGDGRKAPRDGRKPERKPQAPGAPRTPIKPRPRSEQTVRPAGLDAVHETIIMSRPEDRKPANAPKEKRHEAATAPVANQQPKKEAPVKPSKEQRPPKKDNAPVQNNNNNNNDSSASKGKDGRNASKKKKHGQEHDALGSKKQERYVNLEKNGGKKKGKPQPKKPETRNEDEILTLTLPEHLTIRDLADKMKVAPSAIVKKLFMKGTMVTVNSDVTYEQAEEIALEFNCICEPEEKIDVIAELLKEDDEDDATMVSRPPVVCVMGHVDHGKTSLLDAIRNTHVIEREAGGITQKIGAYVVNVSGQKITFLDTPGHEAFTAMRMRGANSTDIAILVVAADDGVMPQTIEAINHAKAAGIEIIVAINKIDKAGANIDRVKQELSEYELIPEDWGGSTVFVPVSAHSGEGIDQLLEMILLTAEVLELKANPKRNARGLVIEAELDKGRGVVATVLVQKGTLHVGDPVAAGSSYGKVRAMVDENGKRLKKAGPSTPVEILGLSEVPNAGEIFSAFDSDREARNFAGTFVSVGKEALIEDTRAKMSLDDLFSQIQAGNVKELDIIVKADVQGSVEAVRTSLEKLSNDEVVVKIIHGGVGAITESDVNLAAASNAIIIGFNVRPDNIAKQTADNEGVDIRLYKVIYNAIEDVEAAMKGMLEPVYEEKVIGHAIVRQIFKSSEVGNIAGSYVDDGYFQRGCKVRIRRGDEQIFEGDLASLKRFKDDVKEVKAGYECGLVFDGFSAFAEDDVIEAYTMVEVPRS